MKILMFGWLEESVREKEEWRFATMEYAWGTVCDYGWDQVDANIVCTELGYGQPGNTILASPSLMNTASISFKVHQQKAVTLGLARVQFC